MSHTQNQTFVRLLFFCVGFSVILVYAGKLVHLPISVSLDAETSKLAGLVHGFIP
jgi:hypothetical protein